MRVSIALLVAALAALAASVRTPIKIVSHDSTASSYTGGGYSGGGASGGYGYGGGSGSSQDPRGTKPYRPALSDPDRISQRFAPATPPGRVAYSDDALRVSVLSNGLARIQLLTADGDDAELDRPTPLALHRNFGEAPNYEVETADGVTTISTALFEVAVRPGAASVAELVRFSVKGADGGAWTPGAAPAPAALPAYVGAPGDAPCPEWLGVDGLRCTSNVFLPSSEAGWTLVADTPGVFLAAKNTAVDRTAAPRATFDGYLFAHGTKHVLGAIHDYVALTGRPVMPPEALMGLWLSQSPSSPMADYADSEWRAVIHEQRNRDMPVSAVLLDAPEPAAAGYSLCDLRFPSVDGFAKWLLLRNATFSHRINPLQPGDGTVVPSFANATSVTEWMNKVVRRMYRAGTRLWWLEAHPDTDFGRLAGLLFATWTVADESYGGRPTLVGPQVAGWGGHRVPFFWVGPEGDPGAAAADGDAPEQWARLARLPYLLSSPAAAVRGMPVPRLTGAPRPEVFVRWAQLAAFSPAVAMGVDESPWEQLPAKELGLVEIAFEMQQRLHPLMYTLMRAMYDAGVAPLRPVWTEFPKAAEAQTAPVAGGQLLVGGEMMVAPIVAPVGTASGVVEHEIWVPPGRWFEWQAGRWFDGPMTVKHPYMLDNVPLFLRASSLVPMACRHGAPDCIEIVVAVDGHISTGETGNGVLLNEAAGGELYEDDGYSGAYHTDHQAHWELTYGYVERQDADNKKKRTGTLSVTISPASTHYARQGEDKTFVLVIPASLPAVSAQYRMKRFGSMRPAELHYDGDEATNVVHLPRAWADSRIEVEISFAGRIRDKRIWGLPDATARSRAARELLRKTGVTSQGVPKLTEMAEVGSLLSYEPERADEILGAYAAVAPLALEEVKGSGAEGVQELMRVVEND